MEDKLEPNEMPKEKKKISKRELIRRVMLSISIIAFIALAIKTCTMIYGYIEARNSTNEVLDGVSQITRPPKESDTVGTLVTDPDELKGSETETKNETENGSPSESETKEPEMSETEPPEPVYSEYFVQWLAEIRKMKAQYPDFVGYIHIEGLNILYPILQTTNNTYYLNHLIDGKRNDRGEIFMDYRNNRDKLTDNRNISLYGHNLYDKSKFHNLVEYQKADKFYSCMIEVITEEGIFTFLPFSFYQTDENNLYNKTDFSNSTAFKEFCEKEKAQSMHKSEYAFTGKEVIITLSTCVSSWGGRWCTHGVLVDVST